MGGTSAAAAPRTGHAMDRAEPATQRDGDAPTRAGEDAAAPAVPATSLGPAAPAVPATAPADAAGVGPAPGSAPRGALLWEYSPPRAHPIVYAGLLLFAVVFVTGSLENLAREQRAAIYAVYALPFLVTLLGLVTWYPSNVRIHERGIAPSRPLLLRWRRPFIPFDDLVAIYPSYYDVTGAFVSPFASSDGKVTQLGLGLESHDGRVETVRFTPSRFQMWQPESRGYLEALDVVKQAWGDRPLVAHAEPIDRAQGEAMLAQANKPFLPFFAIVLLFASAAPVLWLLTDPLDLPVAFALPVALIAPAGVSLRSYVQSRRRHALLDRLSKAAQWRKGQKQAAGAAGTMGDPAAQARKGAERAGPGAARN